MKGLKGAWGCTLRRPLVLLALLLPVFLATSADSSAAPCTIVGTPKADTLKGTGKGDVICGLKGSDRLLGLGSNDILRGGPGDDRLLGGIGRDGLVGGPGGDAMDGGVGDDRFSGGDGVDKADYCSLPLPLNAALEQNLVTGQGTDRLDTSTEEIVGSRGADLLTGSSRDDVIDGCAGNDTIPGEAGDDDLTGGKGADSIDGGSGANPCRGDDSGSWNEADVINFQTCEVVSPPRIVSVVASTDRIDTTLGPQSVVFTLVLEDDLSGFPTPETPSPYQPCGLVFVPEDPKSTQQDYGSSCGRVREDLVTTADGRVLKTEVTHTVTLQRFSKRGNWGVYVGCSSGDPLTSAPSLGGRSGNCSVVWDLLGNTRYVSYASSPPIPTFVNG